MACNTQQTYPVALLQQMSRSLCSIVNEGLPDYSIWAANVKRFGAVGDGVTDDRAAIVAAIESVAATGGVVYFPPGRYYTSSSIPVPYSTGITLQGTGVGSEVLSLAAAEGNKFAITGSNVTVQGLKLNGGYSGGGQAGDFGLINITDCQNASIRDCTITGSGHLGIRIRGAAEDVTIEANRFRNNFCSVHSFDTSTTAVPQRILISLNSFEPNWGTGGETGAVKLQATNVVKLSAGHILSSNTVVGTGQMGFEIWGNGMGDVAIIGNTISSVEFGISLDSVDRCSIVGNVIKLFTYVGIEVASPAIDCVISSNVVDGFNSSGTRAAQVGIITSNTQPRAVTVSSNTIRGTIAAGIQIQTTDGAVVQGNSIFDCGSLVNLKSSSNVVVRSNRLVGITEYHIWVECWGYDISGVAIENNVLEGHANSDNLMLYDVDGDKTLTNLLVRNNNISGATYGNTSINYNLPVERLPGLLVQGNYSAPGVDQAEWPDRQGPGYVAPPFSMEIQGGGIPVAKKYDFILPPSVSSQWVKIMSYNIGRPIVLPVVIQANSLSTPNNTYSTISFIVSASPYQQGCGIMKIPHALFNVAVLSQVIYDNSGGFDTHDVWLKFDPCGGATVTVIGSDFADGWIESPVPVTTEPTWNANHFIMPLNYSSLTVEQLRITNLPTSSDGLPSGAVWNDTGTLRIA